MDGNEWFYTLGIAIGLLVASSFGKTAFTTGKRGKNFEWDASGNPNAKHTALDFNTSETPQQVVRRAKKSIVISVLALLVCWFLSELSSSFNADWVRGAIILLGLILLAPYIYGAKKAYEAAKSREERGVTRLQLLRAAPALYKSYKRFVFYTDKTMLTKNYPKYEGYFGQLLESSRAFFKEGQDGDLVFIFNTATELGDDFRGGIVLYRKEDDVVVNLGIINTDFQAKAVSELAW